MDERFTVTARRVMARAEETARRLNHDHVDWAHVLLGLLDVESVAARTLTSLGISKDDVQLRSLANPGSGVISLAPNLKDVLDDALREAAAERDYFGAEHLLQVLLREGHVVSHPALHRRGIDGNQVSDRLAELLAGPDGERARREGWHVQLSRFTTDLVHEAHEGNLPPAYARDREVERLLQILSRRSRSNPLLVGAPAIGKTSLVRCLARRICWGTVPRGFIERHVYALDLDKIIQTSASEQGCLPRLGRIAAAAKGLCNGLLVIDDLDTLLTRWAVADPYDLARLLSNLLEGSKTQLLATATPDGYRSRIECVPALDRHFQPVLVPELTEPEVVVILGHLRTDYETHHRVVVTDEALRIIARATNSARPVAQWLANATDLIDEASSLVRLRRAKPPADPYEFDEKLAEIRREKESAIDVQDFEEAAALRAQEKELLNHKENRLELLRSDPASHVLGQDVFETRNVLSAWSPGQPSPPAMLEAPAVVRAAAGVASVAPAYDPEIWTMI
ncbi:MAG TPA: Clp protease N-terminal domain-containing protein [Streptosporangiaceae bacterium]|nr:Clp protease N-terminal domain-containing protein [Streptosporangiaceae bacterium]